MLQELKSLLNRNEDLEEEIMHNAAYALLNQQFLRRSNPRQRKYYEVVTRFKPYFTNLTEAMGYELAVEEVYGYAGVIPHFYSRRMKLDETLFLLVMRYMYDEEVNSFHANDDGSVVISVDDAELRYKQLTNRDLAKTKGEFEHLSGGLRRRGIINVEENPDNLHQLFITIYPSITAVINSKAIDNIRLYLRAEDINIDQVAEESEVAECTD